MHKKALLACMLVVTLLMSGCALIEKDEAVDRATEIIRVGDTVYTKGQVQDTVTNQLNYMAYMYSMYGMSYDTTDATVISDTQDTVINSLVENAVKNIKVKELGLDTLTEEEQTTLAANVDATWESNRSSCQSSYFAETELTGDELTAAVDKQLEDLGYTREAVEESEKESLTQDKLRDYVIKDVAVTDEELQTAYDAKVEEAKTSYESSLTGYGTSVNAGNTVYYRPAGYRMVKQILVKFTAEDQAVIDSLNSKITDANTAITTLTTSLTDLQVVDTDALAAQVSVVMETPTDLPEAVETVAATTTDLASGTDLASATDLPAAAPAVRDIAVSDIATVTDLTTAFTDDTLTDEVKDVAKQLATAKAQKAFYETQLANAKTNAFAHIAAAADDISAQLAAGADWDTVMAEKTEDPGMQGDRATAKTGYAVCEGYTSFDSAFVNAAMALAQVGDVSPKTEGNYGYYIIQYTSAVEEGNVPLDDVRETLTAETLATKQDTTFTDQVSVWVTEANAKIDKKALND